MDIVPRNKLGPLALPTYELLMRVQNTLDTQSLLPQFIYFAKSVEEMRKKWNESEARCRDLEDKLALEKSIYNRKMRELKIDIEIHHEKRLEAENRSEKLQMELEKLQAQIEMFKDILKPGNEDSKQANMFINYGGNYGIVTSHDLATRNNNINANLNDEEEEVMKSTKRDSGVATTTTAAAANTTANKTSVEDTNALISDYTEDDIDMNDDSDIMEIVEQTPRNNNNMIMSSTKHPSSSALPPPPPPPPPPPMRPPNPPSTSSLPGAPKTPVPLLHPTLSTAAIDSPTQRRHRRAAATPKQQRPPKSRRTSSNGPPETAATVQPQIGDIDDQNRKYHRRTRSIDRGGGITAITTLQIGQNGQPISVTSEIQHQNAPTGRVQELMPAPSAIIQPTPNKSNRPDLAYMPLSENKNANNKWPMTPMTPHHRSNNAAVTSNLMPLAKKYKKAHYFKQQVILNSENCAHCDKRTRFGKAVMKCQECEMVVHAECRDLLTRPCYPALNFPSQGCIADYIETPSSNDDAAGTRPHIPPILQMIVNEIEARGLLSHEVGLYRVNGSDAQIKQIKDRLVKRHQAPDLRKINDVHVLCGFVKDFLNNLSEHLITYDSWYRFARASDLPNEHDRVAELEQVIEDLPQANRDTLAFMVLHLQRIAETTECRMPASNLARVFGPSLVGNSSPNLPAADIINEVKTQHQIVEALIRLPASFYLQFVETGEQQQQRLFKQAASAIRTPDTSSKIKTAVVLSSILGPAANIQN